MNYDVLLWILLISLAIVLGSIMTLTAIVRSNYAQALRKVSAGQPQEALDLFMRVVGWQTKHVPSLWQVALLHLSMDKVDAAVKNLDRIIAIMDKEPDKDAAAARWEVTESQVLSKLAWNLSKLNKRAEAIAYFKRFIQLEPNNKEGRFELARLLYSTRDYDQSIPMLESVIQLDPAHTEAYEILSNALSAKGQHLQAAEILSKRLAGDRGNVNLWIRLANLYRTGKDNVKQEQAWRVIAEIAPETDPNHIGAVVQLGKLEYLDKQFGKAVQTLKKAASLCPREDTKTLKSVMYYMGRTYLDLDRKTEARKAFTEVYEMDRKYKDIRDLLRESFEVLSDDDLAEELRAMRLDDFSALAVSIVTSMGYKPSSVQTVNETDAKVDAKLEETGKDRPALLYFERGLDTDVGEFAIRSFTIECDEKHVEYPVYYTTGGFSFEAKLKAKDYRLTLMARKEFCEMIRKVRTAV